jgi:putative glutamine amidotransferase
VISRDVADGVPVVGIVARKDLSGTWKGYPLCGQGLHYVRCVALAGGAPLLIPLELDERAWRSIYERMDGLLLAGGVDVEPGHYGEGPHPSLGEVDRALDEAELLLARWALTGGLPVLAICRGIQLINVAAGGSLYQDLPSQVPEALAHSCSPPDYPRDYRAHAVHVEAKTRLSAALGEDTVWTNSRHHQAVKDVAPRFVVTARAPDGVIEGIESIDAAYVVGVQWHPESMAVADPQMLALFESFIQACRRQTG